MRRVAMLLLILAAWQYLMLFRRFSGLAEAGRAPRPAAEQTWAGGAGEAAGGSEETDAWFVLAAPDTGKAEQTIHSALSDRFRLAGTFFSSAHHGGINRRTAIIDQLARGEQLLVEEGSLLDEFQVVAIERDRAILKNGEQEEILTISYQDAALPMTDEQDPAAAATQATETFADNQFARQVGENRWVLNRSALMDYYSELLDDPERIASIYISLKPDYAPNQKIAGYELDMVGENDFFTGMGLQQGDRIRKVNSMNMTSQTRGEYFLKEFVNNRLSAIVLDIERDNVPKKMIYLVR